MSPSFDNSEKSKVNERYASSVRNVALWVSTLGHLFLFLFPLVNIKYYCYSLQVSTALAFGVGLGFKEGIGKASEFFAGYGNLTFKKV